MTKFYIFGPQNVYKRHDLSKDMNLHTIPNFLSDQEIVELLSMALDRTYTPSLVVGNSGPVQHHQRTSMTCMFGKSENPLIRSIENRVMRTTGCSIEDIEPFQLVKYHENDKYEPHYDYFDPVTASKEIASHGQRLITILVYLLCPKSGGETHFPKLGVTVTPKQGNAILWYNCNWDGQAWVENPMTKHGGLPVQDGTKVAMNIWIRYRDQPETLSQKV